MQNNQKQFNMNGIGKECSGLVSLVNKMLVRILKCTVNIELIILAFKFVLNDILAKLTVSYFQFFLNQIVAMINYY